MCQQSEEMTLICLIHCKTNPAQINRCTSQLCHQISGFLVMVD